MGGELVVFGSGGHAKVLIEAVRARDPQRDIYVVDDRPDAVGRSVLGIAVAGTREWLAANVAGARLALGIGDNRARLEILEWLVSQGRSLETVIHPSAIVGATVEVGVGAFFSAGAIAIAEAQIGRGVIINTGASVDHDCVIGDGVHIGPGVRLCGNVRVGARTLIGVGSAVRPGIKIGADVTVGAGSVVVSDLADGGTYCGCPARALHSA
jgi:sugar O-acyltransferase (sialic acid O-acetyltransferase NeuD family)